MSPNRSARLGLVSLLVLALLVVGCASRPDVEPLADAIMVAAAGDATVNLSPAQARCIAMELLASDLSDTTLSGLADDFDNPKVLVDEVDEVEPTVNLAATECIGAE